LELNTKRKAAAASRLRERSLSEWMAVIGRIAASDFCQGKNDRGWVATFDFLIQPSTATKALEGAYDNRTVHSTGKPTQGVRLQGVFHDTMQKLGITPETMQRPERPALAPQRPVRALMGGES
jgi:hypothetical protein